MNLAELIAQAREWLDDEHEPYLWSDVSLTRWADEAQSEACIRTRFLIDDTTPEVCTITLVDGQAIYPLHPSIIVARRFEYREDGLSPRVLTRTTASWLDKHFGGRWSVQEGRAYHVVQDLRARSFRRDRIPTANNLGTLQLQVWRKPLDSEKLESDVDEPVIDSAFHLQLVHWICYRAFLKKDDEAYDKSRAGDHLGQFEAAFGKRPTLQRLIDLATDDAGEIEAYWY